MVASLAALDGMPGGCPDCLSTAEMLPDPKHPGVLVMNVRHNEGCPWFRAYEARCRVSRNDGDGTLRDL